MTTKRPLAIVFPAVFQVLMGIIWLYKASTMPGIFMQMLVASIAIGHFYAAWGLLQLAEWGRQRTVQFALFDVFHALSELFAGHIFPFGALLYLGMPLYTLSALNDREVRAQFS